MSIQSMGEMGKDFCPNVLQPFLENIDRRSCNDGSRKLIPVFHNPHRKWRPSPSSVWTVLFTYEVIRKDKHNLSTQLVRSPAEIFTYRYVTFGCCGNVTSTPIQSLSYFIVILMDDK